MNQKDLQLEVDEKKIEGKIQKNAGTIRFGRKKNAADGFDFTT